jgi:ribonuclease D
MNEPARPALPPGIASIISREDMALLPVRRYEGEICMVATPQELDRALHDLFAESAVGWDTETRPAFRKGESYLPCLFQAATAAAVYLFRLESGDVRSGLAALLEDSRIVKAGISVADDLRGLRQVFPFEEREALDLGRIAHRRGIEQTGLRNLAGIFLGIRIPKGIKTSNWAAKRLSGAQIAYAATDAWVCRELYLRFRELDLLSPWNPVDLAQRLPPEQEV